MFRRILVANRGEVAVRVIRACRELGVETVAVYSTADRDALHVRLADRAVHIGPPSAAESYLKIPALVGAAEITGCEAVHPGWGFLAENADFARACEDGDLVFIGPRPEQPEFVDSRIKKVPYYNERHLVKPGLTGWAQINAPFTSASEEDTLSKLQYDLYYIKNRSMLLDLGILLKTINIVLTRQGR